MPFDFWNWASPQEERDLRALDFERTAKESIQQADANLWARDAGQLLTQSRDQIGGMIDGMLGSVRAAFDEAPRVTQNVTQNAVDTTQQAADQFSSWASDRLGDVRSKLPGYDYPSNDLQDRQNATPELEFSPLNPISRADNDDTDPLLDAYNKSRVKASPQPVKTPPDEPFKPSSTVARDDWSQEWRPQLYDKAPNALRPWERPEDPGTVNPTLAGLDKVIGRGIEQTNASPANPSPNQSRYGGLDSTTNEFGANLVDDDRTKRNTIAVNAREHLVNTMREYWKTTGDEPTSNSGLSAVAKQFAETFAHEVAHDTRAAHDPVHRAITDRLRQAEGTSTHQAVYDVLKQMRDDGSMSRIVATVKSGNDQTTAEKQAYSLPPGAQRTGPLAQRDTDDDPLLTAYEASRQKSFPEQVADTAGEWSRGLSGLLNPAGISDAAQKVATGEAGKALGDAISDKAGDIAGGIKTAADAVGSFVGPGGTLAQGADMLLGLSENRRMEDRIKEIGQVAASQGFATPFSKAFREQNPELTDELDDLMTKGVINAVGNINTGGGFGKNIFKGASDEVAGAVKGGLIRLGDDAAPPPSGTQILGPKGEVLSEVSGVADEAGEAVSAPRRGPSTWASGVDDPNQRYDMHYEVRSLNDLITSHSDDMAPNPSFPEEMQPRLRDRVASADQVNRIASKLSPDALLAETHRLDSGAPIIGPDGIVESGNGRALALRLAQREHPERFAAYQQALRDRADELGLDPADIDGISDPVLVRVRDSELDQAGRISFAGEANQPAVMEMGAFETALQDARRLSPDAMAGIEVSEAQTLDQALLSPANRDLVRGLVEVVPVNERSGMMTADGRLSRAGLERVKAAIFASTYPGDAGRRLAQTFFESPDPNVRNVMHGLMQSLPSMARTEALIRAGERSADLGLAGDLSKAVDVFARLKSQGASVREYVAQTSMWERELTSLQEQLLGHLDDLSRSPRKIRAFIQQYADGVEAQAPEGQTGLFGAVERASKEDLLRKASGGALDVGEEVAPAPTAASGGLEAPGAGAEPPPPSRPARASTGPAAESAADRTARRAESAAVAQEATEISRGAQSAPYVHRRGTGYFTGADERTVAQVGEATNQREYKRVTRDESHAAGTLLALDESSIKKLTDDVMTEGYTKKGAAQVDALRERAVGAIENANALQDEVASLRAKIDEGGTPDLEQQLSAVEKLLTAARDSAKLSLTTSRRYAESAGRTLAQFQYKISAQAAQKVAARVEQLADLSKRARLAIDVKPGKKLITRKEITDLEALADQLDSNGDMLRSDSKAGAAVRQKIRDAAAANGRKLPEDQTLAERLGALEREHGRAHGDSAVQAEISTRREALLDEIREAAEARAREIADAQGKLPKELTPEEIERAINQAIGAPTVTTLNNEALAAERALRGSDAVADPIRKAVDQFRTGERTAIKSDVSVAKYWTDLVIQYPNDAGIRRAAHEAIDTISTHGLQGQKRAEAARKTLEDRLQKSYDQLMADVKRRNDADVLRTIKAEDRFNEKVVSGAAQRNQELTQRYARMFDQLEVSRLTSEIREFVTLAKDNPEILAARNAFGDSRLQQLMTDLDLVSSAGQEQASALRKQLHQAGILHLIHKNKQEIDQDELDGLMKAMANASTPDDIKALIKTMRQPRMLDYIYEIQYVNMLSAPVTHITNAAANVAQLVGRLVFNPLTVAGDVILNPGNRATSGAEIGAAWRGAASGFKEGLREAVTVMKTGERIGASQQAIEMGSLRAMNREFLTEKFGPLGTAMHVVSSRPLEAMDAMLGHMAYASAIEQHAARVARRQGISAEKVLANIWDHPEVIEKAGKVRDYTLLRGMGNGEIERRLRYLASIRSAAPDAGFARQALAFVGNQALPFFNVPLHYTKQGLDRSLGAPINTVKMLTEKDPEARAELFQRAAIGWGAVSTAFILAAGDNLTGDGPSDAKQRQAWLTNHQPNSVRMPGTDRWYSYQSTPWGIPFAIVANTKENIGEAQERSEKKGLPAGEILSAGIQGGIRGTVSGIVNQTFLQNFSQMYQQFTGTNDAFPAIAAGTASRFIQPALLRWFARITDTMDRDATHGAGTGEQIGQRLALGYPGTRQTLPVAKNVLGQERKNQSYGAAGVLPLALQGRTGNAPDSKAMGEYNRLGVTFPQVQATKLGDTQLTPGQQRQYRESAQALRGQLIEKLVESPAYRTADDDGKKRILESAAGRAAAWAGQAIVPRRDAEGYEFLTSSLNRDSGRTIDRYVKAVEANERIQRAEATRYRGVKPEEAKEFAADVRELNGLKRALGDRRGENEFVRLYGVRRLMRVDKAPVDPRYEMTKELVGRNRDWQIFFGPRAARGLVTI